MNFDLTDSLQIQTGALELLADQLTNVADNVRQDAKPSIVKIADSVKKLLSSTSSETLRAASLHALRAIATSLRNGEEHALTSTVPIVLKVVKERQSTLPALEVLLAQACVRLLTPLLSLLTWPLQP